MLRQQGWCHISSPLSPMQAACQASPQLVSLTRPADCRWMCWSLTHTCGSCATWRKSLRASRHTLTHPPKPAGGSWALQISEVALQSATRTPTVSGSLWGSVMLVCKVDAYCPRPKEQLSYMACSQISHCVAMYQGCHHLWTGTGLVTFGT